MGVGVGGCGWGGGGLGRGGGGGGGGGGGAVGGEDWPGTAGWPAAGSPHTACGQRCDCLSQCVVCPVALPKRFAKVTRKSWTMRSGAGGAFYFIKIRSCLSLLPAQVEEEQIQQSGARAGLEVLSKE